MTKSRRHFLQIAAAAASTLPFARIAHGQSITNVRVANGTTPDILSIPDVRAVEHFLPRVAPGVTGKATYVPGAVRAVQAVIAGEAEVGIATLGSGLAAVLQSQEIQVFALASGARPYLVPVATKELTSLKSLEGQEVGVISLVDSTYYLLVMMMQAAGADPTKVQWRVVGGGAGRANALASGGVKAAMFQVGQALELMEKGPFQILPSSFAGLKDFIFKAFWAKKSFLDGNRALAEAIVQANLLATREALDKPAFMAYAVQALAPMSADIISRSYDILRETGPWDPNNALLNKTAGDFTVNEMVRFKVLAAPVAFDKWATTDFVKAAVAKLGPAK